uniref:Reverse transcriptase zinc-binding domain-containing protein n=1 Tax=Cannabis sativa TaxID=3483 RepID=A0A803PTD8_CANSA
MKLNLLEILQRVGNRVGSGETIEFGSKNPVAPFLPGQLTLSKPIVMLLLFQWLPPYGISFGILRFMNITKFFGGAFSQKLCQLKLVGARIQIEDQLCPLCGRENETLEHLTLFCELAYHLWCASP